VVVRVPEGKQLWLVSLSPGSSWGTLDLAPATHLQQGWSLSSGIFVTVTAGVFPTVTQFLNYPRKLQSPTLVV